MFFFQVAKCGKSCGNYMAMTWLKSSNNILANRLVMLLDGKILVGKGNCETYSLCDQQNRIIFCNIPSVVNFTRSLLSTLCAPCNTSLI